MMTDLQDELMGLEDEFNRLQESINKSRSKAARDSGLPESMRNSTEDQDYLEQGARPKNIRTDTIENQRPESPLDPDRRVDRMTDRPSFTSTLYHADLPRYDQNLPRERNVTTCRGTGTARTDKSKSGCVKPDKYDGNSSRIDFMSHFDVGAELNEMDIEEIEEERVDLFDI